MLFTHGFNFVSSWRALQHKTRATNEGSVRGGEGGEGGRGEGGGRRGRGKGRRGGFVTLPRCCPWRI